MMKAPAFSRWVALASALSACACSGNDAANPTLARLTTTGTSATPMTTTGTSTGANPSTTGGMPATTGGGTPATTTGGNGGATAGTNSAGPASTPLLTYDVYNCANGDYTAAVTIGDGQSYRLRLDSGSAVSDVASSACTNCNVSPLYTPGSGAQDQGLKDMVGYADGSGWTAELYKDVFSLGSNMNDVPMAFGAIDAQSFRSDGTGYFFTVSCDGVTQDRNSTQGTLGLGNVSGGNAGLDVFADKVQTTNALPDVFAVHFCLQGGKLWWGGYDTNATTAAPKYTAMDTATQYYYANIQGMSLDGQALGGLDAQSYGPSLVDTGTNVMVLPQPVYQALASALTTNSAFNQTFPNSILTGNCFTAPGMTADAVDAALPKLGVSFNDAQGQTWTATLPPTQSYLETMPYSGQNLYCSAFVSSGNSSNFILGNIFMQSQVVIFDRANKRLGLAPQTGCPAR